MNTKNITAAAGVFAKNGEVKELFFTSDGQCFYKKGPALVHQKEIKGAEDAIETITPDDVPVVEKEDAAPAESNDEVVVEPKKKKQKA